VQVNHATIVPSFLAEARAAIDNLRAREEPVSFSQRLATLCADWQRETGLICDCQIEEENFSCSNFITLPTPIH
jgi:hypothetical protein